jgi:hypothetical protein
VHVIVKEGEEERVRVIGRDEPKAESDVEISRHSCFEPKGYDF